MRLSDEQLAAELAALRPEPSMAFAARLDRAAAEGFPRPRRLGLRLPGPRRVLAPLAAATTLLVVVAVAVAELDRGGGTQPQPAPQAGAPGAGAAEAAPAQGTLDERFAGRALSTGRQPAPAVRRLSPAPYLIPRSNLAPGQPSRVVAASAQLTLAASPDDVQDVADGVVRVAHAHHGIIMSSSVSHEGESAHADFQLAIPSAQLQATLDDLSGLAHVRADNEGQVDITAPYVHAKRDVAELEAKLASLKAQLESAQAIGDTAGAAELARRIRILNFELGQARHRLDGLKRQARYATVAVSVVADRGAGAGPWTFTDALHDAGKVLRYAAGIAVVSAAVLLPLAILALLVGLGWRAWVRRSREAALDREPAEAAG